MRGDIPPLPQSAFMAWCSVIIIVVIMLQQVYFWSPLMTHSRCYCETIGPAAAALCLQRVYFVVFLGAVYIHN